jgi:DNA-binding response OmpR family regulator
MNLLIVDDDVHLRALVKTYAEAEGFKCVEAENGDAALDTIERHNLDIVVLDVMMPGRDGFEILSELRQTRDTPVIMLTARTDEINRLHGFDMGADDYVPKPFSPRELMARIKAVVKRSSGINDGILKFGDLELNTRSRFVTLDGEEIFLTPKEFDLLLYMAKHNKVALPRDQLLNGVWGFDYSGDTRTLDTHIKSLRERLGKARSLIITIRRVGYKFDFRAGGNKTE